MLRALAHSEPEAYSEPCQTFTMESLLRPLSESDISFDKLLFVLEIKKMLLILIGKEAM